MEKFLGAMSWEKFYSEYRSHSASFMLQNTENQDSIFVIFSYNFTHYIVHQMLIGCRRCIERSMAFFGDMLNGIKSLLLLLQVEPILFSWFSSGVPRDTHTYICHIAHTLSLGKLKRNPMSLTRRVNSSPL